MPDFPSADFRPVLDLCEQLRLHPEAACVRSASRRLRSADQRLQPFLQVGRRDLVEPVVHLARADQVVALSPAEIDAVPLSFVEGEVGDGQRLRRAQVFFTQLLPRPLA